MLALPFAVGLAPVVRWPSQKPHSDQAIYASAKTGRQCAHGNGGIHALSGFFVPRGDGSDVEAASTN